MEALLIPYSPVAILPARRVLVLAPHPDDEVFGCGGAIAAHVKAGIPVQVVILTDGGLFGDTALRLDESKTAAGILGYGKPECWSLPDRGVVFGEPLIQRVMQTVQEGGFDLVYAPSLREIHPDHVQLAQVALEAVRRLGDGFHLAQYEVGAPLWPHRLLDITPFLSIKLEAMRCFASQLERQSYDLQIGALNRYRSYTLPKSVEAAEAFRLLAGADLAHSSMVFSGDVNADDLRQQMTMMWVYPEVQKQVVFYRETLAATADELARNIEALAQRDVELVRTTEALAQKGVELARTTEALAQKGVELAETRGLVLQLQAEASRLKAEAAGWRDDSAMWQRGAEKLQIEVRNWQGRADAHFATIEEILSSRSWRITKPLRALSASAMLIRERLASIFARKKA